MSTPSEPQTILARYQRIQDNLIGSSVPKRQRVCEDKWINPARPLPGAPTSPAEKFKVRIEQPRWPMPSRSRSPIDHHFPDPSIELMRDLMASIPTHLPGTPPQKTLFHKRNRSNSAPMGTESALSSYSQPTITRIIVSPKIDNVSITKIESGGSIASIASPSGVEDIPSPLERKIMFVEESKGSKSNLIKSPSFQSEIDEVESKKVLFPRSPSAPELQLGPLLGMMIELPNSPIEEKDLPSPTSPLLTPIVTPVGTPKQSNRKNRVGFTRGNSSDLDQSSANSTSFSGTPALPKGDSGILDVDQVSNRLSMVTKAVLEVQPNQQASAYACCTLC